MKNLSLSEGKFNVAGLAMILHAKPDDFGQPTGNAGGAYGVNQARVWNPADRTKTTIKEQTSVNKFDGAASYTYGIPRGAYTVTETQPIQNQRETTSCIAMGGAGATPWASAGPVYDAAYNAHLNPNREVVSRTRPNHRNYRQETSVLSCLGAGDTRQDLGSTSRDEVLVACCR